MNKIYMAIAAMTLGLMACSSDHTTMIPKYDDSDLQTRVYQLEQTSIAHTNAITVTLPNLISAEAQLRINEDNLLRQRIADEEAARASGDSQLASQLGNAILVQSGVNVVVQAQLAMLLSKINNILTVKIPNLQNQINDKASISYVNSQIAGVNSSIGIINQQLGALQSTDEDLQDQIDALSLEVDANKVKVFKCNMASSEERFLLIGSKYYGTMNQVTTDTVKVITGSTPTTFTNLKLCVKYDDGEIDKMKLPGGNGSCPSSWSTIGGNEVTVPAYSTADKTVVTSVQISLEALMPGQGYVTTDGTAACSFSINANGTTTNLVEVQ